MKSFGRSREDAHNKDDWRLQSDNQGGKLKMVYVQLKTFLFYDAFNTVV